MWPKCQTTLVAEHKAAEHIYCALLAANQPNTCFGFIWDVNTASQAHAAGTGAMIKVSLGGFADVLHGAPVIAEAYIKILTDGKFTLVNPMDPGSVVDLGKMARLIIGSADVLVGSNRAQTLDAQLFMPHGIDVNSMRIIALKSQQHFRGGFQEIAGTIIRADTPGLPPATFRNCPTKISHGRFGRSTRFLICTMEESGNWPERAKLRTQIKNNRAHS